MSVTDLTKIETLVKGTVMIDAKKNFERSGYLFMSTAWVQSVMVDLTLLKNNPDEIEYFKENTAFSEQLGKKRKRCWKDDFSFIKKNFFLAFENIITEDEKEIFDNVHVLRNILAHSRGSTGKGYLLHVPRNQKAWDLILETVKIESNSSDDGDSGVIKMDFSNENIYKSWENVLGAVYEGPFPRLAEITNIPLANIC